MSSVARSLVAVALAALAGVASACREDCGPETADCAAAVDAGPLVGTGEGGLFIELPTERAAPHCHGDGPPLFDDATAAAGLGHVHEAARSTSTYFRSIGGGAAVEDLDGDGDLDVYASSAGGPNALLLNQGDGTFLDFAADRGVAFLNHVTHGASAADYDNDGDADLLLLGRGGVKLLNNLGPARFADVTSAAGLALGTKNYASAAWSDLDGDGRLDVALAVLASDYPGFLVPTPDHSELWRNVGDGRFEDATLLLDVGLPSGAAFVVSLADLDDDGRGELLLPQEFGYLRETPLYKNAGAAGFVRVPASGLALPQAPMGGALLDVDGDERVDVFFTNLDNVAAEGEMLLLNEGSLNFGSAPALGASAMRKGLPENSPLRREISWGAAAFDRENDGDEELYVVYGDFVWAEDALGYQKSSLDQDPSPNALLEKEGGVFHLLSGTCAEEAGTGRGVVAADLEEDGCVDLLVFNVDGPVRYLRNRCEGAGRLLTLQLEGTESHRDAVGARVDVRVGAMWQTRWVTGGSLQLHSSGPRRLYFGLGNAARADEVRVRWPSGREQVLSDVEATGLVHVQER